jgi:putative nucleotidyltransferase with HDIG domain
MTEKLLIVDDETALCSLLVERFSREGYTCVPASNGREALSLFHQSPFALIIADFRMPEMNGLELLQNVKAVRPDIMVIVMTAFPGTDIVVKALRMGAFDFLVKPFDLEFMVFTVKKALVRRNLEKRTEAYHRHLEEMVQERSAKLQKAHLSLKKAHLDSVKALVEAIDAKDPYTRGHSNRVRRSSVRVAKKLGLSKQRIENLEFAALLHDIGKIGVKDEVLQKKSPLTEEEFRSIQEHPLIGVKILEEIEILKDIIPVIRHHHERFDGGGYPDGLAGEKIPLEARILTVADSFDAMTSFRPYRPALSLQKALAELERGQGGQFDPRVLEIFLGDKIYYP